MADQHQHIVGPRELLDALPAIADVTFYAQDLNLKFTWVHACGPAPPGADALGRTDFDLGPDELAAQLVAVKREVLATGETRTVDSDFQTADGPRRIRQRIAARRAGNGEIRGLLGAVVDLAGELRLDHELAALKSQIDEESQRHELAMREVAHRSRNLFAVIQSIARQSAQSSGDLDEFATRFSDRLRALATAQQHIADSAGTGARLGELIRLQIGHYVPDANERLHLEGPDVTLSIAANQSLGMAVHELATNAIKHGALSVPGGKVSVAWSRSGADVEIRWRESGGPPIEPPKTTGFGHVVIERNLRELLGAEVAIDYARSGLAVTVTIPAKHLTEP